MKSWKIAVLAASLALSGAFSASAMPYDFPGYAKGAEILTAERTHSPVDLVGDVVYEKIKAPRGGNVRQMRMSLLIPRTEAKKPAIVYFPGGGFTSANHDKFIEMRLALAERGFVVAAAEYRVVPNTFPAPVIDGKAAVRYLRAHADEYGIDPTRIGVLGDSAGGWMAQMMGTTNGETAFDIGDDLGESSDVQAAVTLYGISDLTNIGEGFEADIVAVHGSPAVTEALLVNGPAFNTNPGQPITSDKEKALAASPMGHLDGDLPPFLILHGNADRLVSPVQSSQLYEAMKARGAKADYLILDGAGHGDAPWYHPALIRRVADWFVENLAPELADGAAKTDDGTVL